MQRAQKFRMIGLAGVAALAIAVPLGAAMAGPADTATPSAPVPRARMPHTSTPGTSGATSTAENNRSAKRGAKGEMGGKADNKSAGAARAEGGLTGPLDELGLPLLSGRTSRCGPELNSTRGIKVQTCVLAERGRTWARTYYRNITGSPLHAVLTLLRPDGRTVQVNCKIPRTGRPGMCETPIARTVRKARVAYDAVAEISDVAGEQLLLRSGSNSKKSARGSLL
ncbi:hypothetical protein SSP35_03_05060 [Streptomyces sp. NBRC 110611]|uniref:hypothetical protein n=1 Tax=Streptomyces sp. NBRC 110611 TaxID=1621259 RepID=UPI00082DA3AC|nr:hypothetical protein [Streptomyces sp. NBRC 110611]GAU66858.1 hypothetical protein SSP35_03_05060 [Streptomyces sp. NBRC 110611]